MVAPTSGIHTGQPENMKPNMDAPVKPHPALLASTRISPDVYVCVKLMVFVAFKMPICLSQQPAQILMMSIVLA